MVNNVFQVQVTIKNTLKKYLKENTNVEVLDHIQDLVLKMEDRNTDGTIKSDTVLGVLHDNLKLNEKACIIDDFNITYDEIDL